MLSAKAVKYGVRLALALILGLAVVGSLPIPVQAQEPIDLVLGGEGATSWNIGDIKPGDSGTKTVTAQLSHCQHVRHAGSSSSGAPDSSARANRAPASKDDTCPNLGHRCLAWDRGRRCCSPRSHCLANNKTP